MSLSSSFSRMMLVVAVASISFVIGCGGDTPADNRTPVQFWTFQSEPLQKEALRKQIEEFEQQNPDLHVEVTDLSWNDGKSKLLVAFNSNQAPDVLELGSDWVAQFASGSVLMDQTADAANAKSRFAEAILAPGMWDGKLFALPWFIDTRVLFYNKRLLAAAGIDTSHADTLWSEVLDHAEKVRQATGAYGFGAIGSDANRLYKRIIPFFWSNGGEVLNASGKPVINSPENVEALRVYLELTRTGLFDTQKGLDGKFIQDSLAFWISGSWLAEGIAKNNPGLQYATAPLPGFPSHPSVSFLGGDYLAINAATEHKPAAEKLVAFLTSAQQSLQFCKDLGSNAPADLSVANDPYMSSPARAAYTEQLRSARTTPVHPKWLDMQKIIEDEVVEALYGRKSEQQALDDAQAKISQLLSGGDGEE